MDDERYGNSNLCLTGESRWLRCGLMLSLVLVCALALSADGADVDLWGHVQYGRDLLANGLPATTTYSFTAQGYRWINHENLAEVLMAIGADTIGATGLLAAKLMMGVCLIGLILHNARRHHVSMLTLCVLSLLVVVVMMRQWALRPQLLSYMYFALMLALLSWCFGGWEGRWRLSLLDRRADIEEFTKLTYSHRRMYGLWLLPLLFVFWANSHGGFAAGFCFLALYLVLRSAEAFACLGKSAFWLACRFGVVLAASALATFVNPYGAGLHEWLFRALGSPRPEIVEWHPPDVFQPESFPLLLIFVTWVLALIFTRRSRDFTHMACMAVAAWQTMEHQRHAAFFAIAFGLWMPAHIESVLRQLRLAHDSTAFGVGMPGWIRVIFAPTLCFLLIVLIGRLSRRLDDMPVDRKVYPVSAMQYIADRDLTGKLVVTYNWAQYAIAAFGTNEADPDGKGIQVAFDGRFRTSYPQEVIDMHFDLVLGDLGPTRRYRSPNSPPVDGDHVLEFGEPDLVLIDRTQPHSEEVMQRHRDEWTLLYQDRLAQLWGRAAKYDEPTSHRFIPPRERDISDAVQRGNVPWPALPGRRTVVTKLAQNIER